jgi:aspartyl-tRNA(Asn)/glutamyl-tRNA(Gln) amidotransferase subunit C
MTGRIDESEVRRIAHLARLKLGDEEAAQFGEQLGRILEYMQKLNEADTTKVEPTAHPLPVSNVFRNDEPTAPLGVHDVLANAPDSVGTYFKVPKVLDQDSA